MTQTFLSRTALSLALSLVGGCAAGAKEVHPVQRRAPFDLDCPTEQTRYAVLDSKTIGATGCGRRATYIKVCQAPNWRCQWVVDVASSTGR